MIFSPQTGTIADWIVVVVLAFTAVVLIRTTRESSKTAKRHNTVDLLFKDLEDDKLVLRNKQFGALRQQGNLSQWADRPDSNEIKLIHAVLNRYEVISIGILEGIIDEKSFKAAYRSSLVRDWIACKPFVMQIRASGTSKVYFSKYEELARMWAEGQEEEDRV